MSRRKKILFVCVHNSCRSQIAEGFARHFGDDAVEVYSAGSKPSGEVDPNAIAVMREVGIDISKQRSKSIDEIPQVEYDFIVTMGCGDACP
ncbi:MAG TPA: arsenate reductase ArsC, partial [Armatimonadetes bacterium]|nr:arsenate reductase ArsC [Armatimonadota bacterium]